MGFVSRDSILGADDREVREIDVPEWGGKARLMSMSGDDRDRFETKILEGRKGDAIDLVGMRALLVGLCLVDEKGKRLFSDNDLRRLGAKSAKVLSRLYDEAARMNGITKADEDELMEDLS